MASLEASTAKKPKVTLILGPRERFSSTAESLESIYQDTDYPFEMIFVDVCSPKPVQRYLAEKSQEKAFKVIRTDKYVTPSQSKNVGLRYIFSSAAESKYANSDYIVFVENDVLVKKGWLAKLVQCAEETGAAVVSPLTCIGRPLHQVIHNAGGRTYIETVVKNGQPRRRLRQSAHLTGRAVAEVTKEIRRVQCDYVEFHCMLVRADVFERVGLLDEGMLSTREHIDFCLTVGKAGGAIYSEREAMVTTDTVGIGSNKVGLMAWFGKLAQPDFKLYDLPYFMLRWNDAWDLASLHHLRDKWDLAEDKYFKKRYAGLGSRRHELLIKPFVKWLTFGQGSPWLEKLLISIERRLNRYVYRRYIKRYSTADQPLQPVVAQ